MVYSHLCYEGKSESRLFAWLTSLHWSLLWSIQQWLLSSSYLSTLLKANGHSLLLEIPLWASSGQPSSPGFLPMKRVIFFNTFPGFSYHSVGLPKVSLYVCSVLILFRKPHFPNGSEILGHWNSLTWQLSPWNSLTWQCNKRSHIFTLHFHPEVT